MASFETKLERAVFEWYDENRDIELSIKEVQEIAQNTFDYWLEACLDDVLEGDVD